MLLLLPIGDENPRRGFPFVNIALIVANAAVFATYAFAPDTHVEALFRRHAMIPASWTWETLFSSMFLHGGFAHLAGNMLFLWITGDNVEDRLGHVGYLVFYLLAGAMAGIAHAWADPRSGIPCVGASGAISGVMAAYLVLFPRARIRFWGLIFLFVFVRTFSFRLPALVAIGLWFAEQVLLLRLEGAGGATQVAYAAHVGGFAAGIAAALLLKLTGLADPPARKRTR